MKRWSLRHTSFKIGFGGIVISSLLFLVGFIGPGWRNNTGLWLDCSTAGSCISIPASQPVPVWFDAVRGLECMAFTAFVVCIAVELFQDFYKVPPPRENRWVEFLSAIAGVLGLIGTIVFAAFTPVSSGSSAYGIYERIYLSWGYGLTVAASACAIAFASVLAYSRYRIRLPLSARAITNTSALYSQTGTVTLFGGPSGVVQFTTNMSVAPPSYNECVRSSSNSLMQWSAIDSRMIQSPHSVASAPLPPLNQPPPYNMPPAYSLSPPPYMKEQVATTLPTSTTANSSCSVTDVRPHVPPVVETSDALATQIPSYYITVQGQLVPVYSEEQSQSVNNPNRVCAADNSAEAQLLPIIQSTNDTPLFIPD